MLVNINIYRDRRASLLARLLPGVGPLRPLLSSLCGTLALLASIGCSRSHEGAGHVRRGEPTGPAKPLVVPGEFEPVRELLVAWDDSEELEPRCRGHVRRPHDVARVELEALGRAREVARRPDRGDARFSAVQAPQQASAGFARRGCTRPTLQPGEVGRFILGRIARCIEQPRGALMIPLVMRGMLLASFEFGRRDRPFLLREAVRMQDVVEALAERIVVMGWDQ